MVCNEFRCIFLSRAADLTDHDDAFGFFVILEQTQHIDEIHTLNGVTPDADAGRLSQAGQGGLVNRLVGQECPTVIPHPPRPLL